MVKLRDEYSKEKFDKGLGKRVKKYREQRGMTLADVADVTGYSGAYVNYIERAVNTPSSYVIWLFAKAFSVPVEQLYPHTENEIDENLMFTDKIFREEGFKPYLELAKKAYLKKINPKILDNSIKILSEK